MKRLGKVVICLASGLVLNASARADDSVLPNNPYAPIVVRNVFNLNPAQSADSTNATPADLPKITPNGIMSIFNHQLQVLFKVAGTPKAGQPAKDESYILSEGQRQDDIEVIQIDEKNSLVTFNNHGIVQELPLAKATASAGSTPTPGPGKPFPFQNFTTPGGENSGRIPTRFGGRTGGGGPAAARNRGMDGGNNSGLGGGFSGQTSQQSPSTMSPDEQAKAVAKVLLNRKLMPPPPVPGASQ